MHAILWWIPFACVVTTACQSPESQADGNATAAASATPPSPAPCATKPRRVSVRGIARPLETDTRGFVLADRVDVGNEDDERAHQYSIKDQTFRGTQDFDSAPGEPPYLEDGRGTKSSESFQVKVIPHRDHLLVKAFDALSKDQKVRVFLDGVSMGNWGTPKNAAGRYGEVTLPIPGALIGDRSTLNVRLQYVSGIPDANAFVYWLYADPEKLVQPLVVDLTGTSLTDTLDIGNDGDEARHQYVIDKSSFAGTNEFESPKGGGLFVENGRATRSFETFRMKVRPGVEHVLVKAFDTLSRDQVVKVSVDGASLGEWALPNGPSRYGEAAFTIPAKAIGDRSAVTVRIDFVRASIDMNGLRYWAYARGSVEPTVQASLGINP